LKISKISWREKQSKEEEKDEDQKDAQENMYR